MRATSFLWVAALLPLGCGGAESPLLSGDDGTDGGLHDSGPYDGNGSTDGNGRDAIGNDSETPWSPVCPIGMPAAGASCSPEGAQCEYGGAWWSVSCDTVMQCQSGRWSVFRPSFAQCSPPPGPNPPACPADYASVPQGGQCTPSGLSCNYAQANCSCLVPLGGPVQIDGGSAYWGCVPEPGCPMPRPRLGTACGGSSTYCTYEACSYGESCQGGVWIAQQEACAGAQ
ncbi:MAG TPA: hypothetical protein VIF15_07465 [Polyangiaceae bacterium]|jgi:hypothetical protein